MTVLCRNKDCKHFSEGVCTAGTIQIDKFQWCLSFEPLHTCGECSRFPNEDEFFVGRFCNVVVLGADTPADMDCFEERSELNAEAD